MNHSILIARKEKGRKEHDANLRENESKYNKKERKKKRKKERKRANNAALHQVLIICCSGMVWSMEERNERKTGAKIEKEIKDIERSE